MSHTGQQSLFAEPSVGEFSIVFDGGALGNPGHGYGSYAIDGSNGLAQHERLDYQHLGPITNNQAEYRTLIGALTWLRQHLGSDASQARVRVNGDSLLVINQLKGQWKVKNEGLRPLHLEAKKLLGAFGHVDLRWHERKHSVRKLGH